MASDISYKDAGYSQDQEVEHIILSNIEQNIYKLDSEGNCALSIALLNDQKEIINALLIQYETDITLIKKQFSELVYIATEEEEIEVSKLCDINNGGTPVKIYIKNREILNELKIKYINIKNDLNILNNLNKNGLIDVNVRNKSDKSILDIAVQFNCINAVKRLLKLGAVGKNKVHFRTTLYQALYNGVLEIIEEMLKYDSYELINDEDNIELLHHAARGGNVEVFNLILNLLVEQQISKERIEDNEKYKFNIIKTLLEHRSSYDFSTVLHKLVFAKRFDCVIELLKYKPNLNVLIREGDNLPGPLLEAAAEENSIELLKALLIHGADLLRYNKIYTFLDIQINALNEIAAESSPELFTEVIKMFSHVFKKDLNTAVDALHSSVEYQPIECSQMLLDLGMDLNSLYRTRTSLVSAAWTEDIDKVKFVINNLKVDPITRKCIHIDTKDAYGNTPLTTRYNTTLDIFKYLIEQGANIDESDTHGWSALLNASRTGNFEHVKILIENDVNTKQINDQGNTAVHLATKSGSYETFKLLFNSDTNIEMRNFKGQSLLMLAAKSQNYLICDELIKGGADVLAVNNFNYTALHYARKPDVIELLIKNGADQMALDNKGNTPYLLMAARIEFDVFNKTYTVDRDVSILNHLNFDIDYSIINFENQNLLHYILQDVDYCYNTYQEIFKEKKFESLFEYTGCDYQGRTIFLLACNVKNAPVELFEKIISCSNPDLNSKSYDGTCAIQTLMERGNITALEYILKKGANVDILTNVNGETPLISAASKSVEIVELLLKYGADVNRQDALGGTAMHKAVQQDCFHIASMLVAVGADLKIKDFNDKIALDYDENGYMKEFLKPFL